MRGPVGRTSLGKSGALMRILSRGALAVLCVFAYASVASAQDYRLPPPPGKKGIELTKWFHVYPYGRFYSYYTTNLFQTRSRDKVEETGFELTAGLDATLGDPKSPNFLSLGYAATQLEFVKFPKQDTVEQRARYATHAELDNKLLTFDSQGSAAWAATNTDPQFAGRVRNFTGFGSAEVGFHPTDTFGLRVDGDMSYIDNFPREFRPTDSLTSRVGVFTILTPNLPWGLEIEAGSNWRQIHYVHRTTNPDLEFVSWQAGLRTRERELVQAERVLAASTLLERRDLERRIGRRTIGEFLVEVARPEPTLFRIAVATADHPDAALLVTVVYRPGERRP